MGKGYFNLRLIRVNTEESRTEASQDTEGFLFAWCLCLWTIERIRKPSM